MVGARRRSEQIEIDRPAVALIARHATGSFRDALGTLEQLLDLRGADEQIAPADVLAVLGVADAEQLFEALDAVIARDPAAALRCAARARRLRPRPGQLLRDLEVHGRELLTVKVLDEVPAEELRVTPERDERLADPGARAAWRPTSCACWICVSAALDATANGAQARIQLELVLIKAAAPEVDPSTAALLARIERLEAAWRQRARARPRLRATAAPPRRLRPRPARRRRPRPRPPPAPREVPAAHAGHAQNAAPRLRRPDSGAAPASSAPADAAPPPPATAAAASADPAPTPSGPLSCDRRRLLARGDRRRAAGERDARRAAGRRPPGGARTTRT